MAERYQGACPICGLTLVIADGNGNRLDCVSGHYSASRQAFERVWADASAKVKRSTTLVWDKASLDSLFKQLDAINQTEISPKEVARLRDETLDS